MNFSSPVKSKILPFFEDLVNPSKSVEVDRSPTYVVYSTNCMCFYILQYNWMYEFQYVYELQLSAFFVFFLFEMRRTFQQESHSWLNSYCLQMYLFVDLGDDVHFWQVLRKLLGLVPTIKIKIIVCL